LSTSPNLRLPSALAAALAACFAPSACAFQTGTDWLQASGFLSQTALYTTDNNFFGSTDDRVSYDYREVGAVLSMSLAQGLRFSTQILSRRAGANDDGSVKLDHAVLSYDFVNAATWTAGVRAGRMKSIIGWYNETRDVPFTRSGIFLPSSVYAERTRNSSFFQDGVMLRGEWRPDMDTLSWHVGYHIPRIDRDEILDVLPLSDGDVADTDGKDSWSASLVYELDGGRMRFGAFYQENNLDVDLAGDLSLGAFSFPDFDGGIAMSNRKTVLSFEYTLDRWLFVAERVDWRIKGDVRSSNPLLGPLLPQFSPQYTSPAWYYQLVYRLSDTWNVFARYERFAFNDDDMYGEGLAANPMYNFRGLPPYAFYASARSVGAEWWLSSDWLLRAEWHNFEGTSWLNAGDNEDVSALRKYWDLVALQLSFRF
jgi:hypothetical protein